MQLPAAVQQCQPGMYDKWGQTYALAGIQQIGDAVRTCHLAHRLCIVDSACAAAAQPRPQTWLLGLAICLLPQLDAAAKTWHEVISLQHTLIMQSCSHVQHVADPMTAHIPDNRGSQIPDHVQGTGCSPQFVGM